MILESTTSANTTQSLTCRFVKNWRGFDSSAHKFRSVFRGAAHFEFSSIFIDSMYRRDMLEGRSCMVSRALPNSGDQENIKWSCISKMSCHVGSEVPNVKRSFDIDLSADGGLRKVMKVRGAENKWPRVRLDWLSLTLAPPVDHSDSREQSDMDSLIQPIGRDLTINCLLHLSRSDYGLVASLNRSFRSLIKSGEIYRVRRQNAVVEHWVYFSCGLLEWVAFDPVKTRWMLLPDIKCSPCFMCSDKESLGVGTNLLVFGRDVMSHAVYKYSILTNSWSVGINMNFPRCLFGSASLGEIAILAGGCNAFGKILSSAELFDSEKQTWVTLPNMLKPRKMCSAVFMDGKFYVIGGDTDGGVLTSGEEFDLKTWTWREIPGMDPGHADMGRPAYAEAPPLVAVVNNQLYAADYADMAVKQYNKETGSWVTLGRLPERADSMNGWGLAFRACGDRLIVIGGPKTGNGRTEINSWIPNGGPPKWELLARKKSGSFVYNCAVMGC